jgi:hypothetical protein
MKHIKNFESFDFSKTLPIAPKDALTEYYHCDDCNALWREVNQPIAKRCKYCTSDEVENLSRDEWYETVKTRLDEDEIEELEANRKSEEETFIDLTVKNNKNYGN